MLYSLREEAEGKLQTILSPRKNGLTSLFKEVRVFKVLEKKTLENSPNVGAGIGWIWRHREEVQRFLHETMRLAEEARPS